MDKRVLDELANIPEVPDHIFEAVMNERKPKVLYFGIRSAAALFLFAAVSLFFYSKTGDTMMVQTEFEESEMVYVMDDISSYDILSDL